MLEHWAKYRENLARSADQVLQADAEMPKFSGLGRKNIVTYPPMTHTFPKTAFSHRFQKVYTYPPPPYVVTCLHIGAKDVKKNPKVAKCTKLAQTG